MDWNDEQAVIDTFVAAVHVGSPTAAKRAGQRLIKRVFTGEWSQWTNVSDGTLLRPDEIPLTPDERVEGMAGVEALASVVSAERLAELQDEINEGESLTPDELSLWRKLAAEEILTENPDCDVFPLWGIRSVTHSDGRIAFLADLGGGYSFTQPWAKFICGTRTEDDALAELRGLGFISLTDYRARWNAVVHGVLNES